MAKTNQMYYVIQVVPCTGLVLAKKRHLNGSSVFQAKLGRFAKTLCNRSATNYLIAEALAAAVAEMRPLLRMRRGQMRPEGNIEARHQKTLRGDRHEQEFCC